MTEEQKKAIIEFNLMLASDNFNRQGLYDMGIPAVFAIMAYGKDPEAAQRYWDKIQILAKSIPA